MSSYKNDKVFCQVYPDVLHVEGGFVNDPKDPGGPTMFGIAWNYNTGALQKLGLNFNTMQNLTKVQALQIYYESYWLRSGAERISNVGLAYLHLDTAVNCGVGEASKILRSLSTANKTHDRLQFLHLIHEYESLRLEYYNHLRPSLKARYLQGWLNRMKYVSIHAEKLAVILTLLLSLAAPVWAENLVTPSQVKAGHVNASAQLQALNRTDRLPRSWKTLKLVPGKVYRWYYTWILEDGSTVVKVERSVIKGIQDDRPLSQSHPNGYVCLLTGETIGGPVAAGVLALFGK